ncbi:MAG: radical SAM protein [Candidatus Electrothrix sp.]
MSEQPIIDCLGTESDDLNRYLAKAAATQTPLAASFELTHRCNFRCVHCYLGDQQSIHRYRDQELDTGTILRLLEEMAEAGTLFLTLTGGDPMLRPDFIRIYEHAVSIGLLVSVYCNGTLITDEIISSFARYPPRIVEVTLYGATAEIFERITQKSGSFTACMEGISRLRRAEIRLRLKTIVMTLNYEELPAMRKTAEDMGLQFRHDCSIIPALPNEDNGGYSNRDRDRDAGGNDLQKTLLFRLGPEQAAAVDIETSKVKGKLRELAAQETTPVEPSKKLHHCGAARSSYHITPYGSMQPCIITLRPSVNLVAGPQGILDSWKTLCGLFTEQEASMDFICNSCSDKKICTGCPIGFSLETGNPEEIPSFYCKYAACRRKESSAG